MNDDQLYQVVYELSSWSAWTAGFFCDHRLNPIIVDLNKVGFINRPHENNLYVRGLLSDSTCRPFVCYQGKRNLREVGIMRLPEILTHGNLLVRDLGLLIHRGFKVKIP